MKGKRASKRTLVRSLKAWQNDGKSTFDPHAHRHMILSFTFFSLPSSLRLQESESPRVHHHTHVGSPAADSQDFYDYFHHCSKLPHTHTTPLPPEHYTTLNRIHPQFRNINLHNVTHSLISRNLGEYMFIVQISLLIVTFLSFIS
jgi:hypothetical protein